MSLPECNALPSGNGFREVQRSTLCQVAMDSERFARRCCRAKAPNNDQAPSLANRLRSFANESAGCLLQMPDFFFHPLCVGFSLTAWRRAVLDSVRELFTDPCKRNPCSQLCLPCQDAEQPPCAIACNCRIQWWLSNPLGQCQILPVGVLNGHAEHMHLLQIL